MAKKANKFNISINSIGTTEMNVEGNKELVRDIARMIINPIANHRVDLLENELLRTNAAKDSEISQLHQKVEELERSKSIQDIKLDQLDKKIELKDKSTLELTSKGMSIENVKFSDEFRATNRFNNNDKYTGIKVTDDGEEKYQCRYVCPNCEYKGKRFVFEHNNVAYCHKCNEKMKLYSVKSLTGQEKDIFNNYYAAGLYKPIMNDKRKEDE